MSEKTVVDYLNEVTYHNDENYVPSTFALEFLTFIKLVNGKEGEENKSPTVHLKMLDTICDGKEMVANMCHRGMAKTTVMGEYLFLYLAVYGELPNFGKVNFALYVSDSMDNGAKSMRNNLEFRWNNSEFLQHYIPSAKFTDLKCQFTNIDGETFILKLFGAKTGVRGTKEQGKRPQLAVLDDLISDEDARSPVVISKIEDTIYKAVTYALGTGRRKLIWSGTPFNARDPLYKAVESGAWSVNVFPVCERFPCSRKEFKGSWPDRFTYDYVNDKYESAKKLGKIDTFNQELMLRIMSDEDRLIDDAEIQWYRNRQTIINRVERGAYNCYITTDFATRENQSSDYSVISVWAYTAEGHWFWIDGICARQDMGKNVNDLFTMVRRYNPTSVGIEVSGQQGGFIPWIEEQMVVQNCFFTLASDNNSSQPGIRPLTNKLQRFQVIVPWFKQMKMHFPHELKETKIMQEMYEEMSLASPGGFKSKKDDFADTISMLAVMNAYKPSKEPYGQDLDTGIGYYAKDPSWENTDSVYDSYIV